MVFRSLPVDGPLRITSRFGPRNISVAGASKNHQGVDLGGDRSKPQTKILAVDSGTVSSNYWNKYRGWVVVIQHDGDWSTLYQHLKQRSPLPVGTKVSAGETIGIMGNSADPTVLPNIATHLHFELRKHGVPVDPEPYLKRVETPSKPGKEEVPDMTKKEIELLIDQKLNERLSGEGKPAPTWAQEFLKEAEALGISDGSRPAGYVTRAECMTMAVHAVHASRKEAEE